MPKQGILDRFKYKVLSCPSCQKKVRIPIRPGKTLRVDCPRCSCQFELKFQSPFHDLFRWEKNLPFIENVKTSWCRFKVLPKMIQLQVLFAIVLLGYLLYSLTSFIFS